MNKIAEKIKDAILNHKAFKDHGTEITVCKNDLIVTVKNENIAVIGKRLIWISYCGKPTNKRIQNRIHEILNTLNIPVGPEHLNLTNILKNSTAYHPIVIPGNF